MVNPNWMSLVSSGGTRIKIMRPVCALILFTALFALAGCTQESLNPSDAIDMQEWCASDADMPWTGCWQEIRQIDCETGDEFEPEDAIGELRLLPDGHYSITWHPFETFTDYAGTYTIDQAQGKIAFNYDNEPGFNNDGTYSIRENGDLELLDIWFGSFYKDSDSGSEKASCGYVFR